MHSTCWQKYFDNVVMKEHRRPYRHRHPASFDVEKQEFLCPLCECLSNTVLPLIPPLGVLQAEPSRVSIQFEDWLKAVQYTSNNKSELCHGVFKCRDFGSCRCDRMTVESNGEGDNVNECDPTCSTEAHRKYIPCAIEQVERNFGPQGPLFSLLFQLTIPEFGDTLKDMIDHYALATFTRGLSVNQNLEDKRVPLLMWKSCAYTIHTMETLLRDTNKPLLGYLSSRQRDCLESLVRIIGVFGSTWKHSSAISGHAFQLIRHIIDHTDAGPSILDWDSLGMLIPLTMSFRSLYQRDLPTAVPTGGTLDLHIFRLVFAAHIVKILITTNFEDMDVPMDMDDVPEDLAIINVLQMLNKNSFSINSHVVWKHVQYAAMPFLRCCVLFYRYLTDVSAPASFTEPGGDSFNSICEYLGVPDTSNELLGSPVMLDIINKWCNHTRVKNDLCKTPFNVIVEPLPINRLVTLPNDYSELINAVSLFTCPNSDREDSRNPTMCLVCGEMLCSQSYCCQIELNKAMVGACTYHAHVCGAGVGVFLRVRECEILFLASPMRGCFVSPPYLDDYGETDQGLRRGNPLHLCPEKYKKLQSMWLSHCIHEEIARAIESSSNLMSTQWQHL